MTTSRPCSAALPPDDSERLIGAMADDRAAARRSARAQPARRSCASPGPATWAGWCRAMARSMPANMASTRSSRRWSRRSPRNSLTSFDASRERCWIADIDGGPVGSVFLVTATATRSQNCGCCWSTRPARGQGLGQRLVDECIALRAGLRLPQDHAVDPEHSGRRAKNLSGRRLCAGGDRAASQLWPEPDRRDLGARAVKPMRRDTAAHHAGTDGVSQKAGACSCGLRPIAA